MGDDREGSVYPSSHITLVSVPESLLRSIKEDKLGYVLGRDGSQLTPGSRKLELVASRIDVLLESGSTRPWIKSA